MTFMKAGLVAAAIVGVLATGVANAAAASDTRGVNVPFAFTVNGKVMAAGHYLIERSVNPSVVVVRGQDGEGLFVTTELPDESSWAESPAVTFTKSGNTYELSTIAGVAVLSTK